MPAEPAPPFGAPTGELPLFPLQAVLFPGGLLGLKVFETRFLDLVTSCLRDRTPFGVVARSAEAPGFEAIGTVAELLEADSEVPGILQLRTNAIADDEALAPRESLLGTVRALATTIATLQREKNEAPFLQPYCFDEAGWVANRWCEILPIPQAARQKLMALPDPMVRLQLVDEYLRGKGVVS